MHLYFIARGNKFWLDEFITQLQGKYLPTKFKINDKGQLDEKGKEQTINFQLGVRPIQLYELAFPEEHRDLILNTILNGNKPHRDDIRYKVIEKALYPLRKLLGASKVKSYNKDRILPITNENIDIFVIGTKKDKKLGWGEGL